MSDRFLSLAEVATRLPGKTRSVKHLREIAEAQHGMFSRPRFSQVCLASYPRFIKGVGGEWGLFESQIEAKFDELRAKARSSVVHVNFHPARAARRPR